MSSRIFQTPAPSKATDDLITSPTSRPWPYPERGNPPTYPANPAHDTRHVPNAGGENK